MALKTTLEKLEAVQAAIFAVLNGQSYSYNGRSMTRADLDKLRSYEKDLLMQLRGEQGKGGPAINIGIHRRDY